MKDLYSFVIKRKLKEKVTYEKENKKGDIVEAFKTKTKTLTNRVMFSKPSFADIEDAEFFYGQKYNDFINSGYLTRLMLNKKIGDIGGSSSKLSEEVIQKAFLDNMEAAKVIEFYEGQKGLEEEQEQKLNEAKEAFAISQKTVADFEEFHRSQYNQTAEAKAEQKLIEWFIFNFSFYEDEVDGKKETFPLFVGDDYEERRAHYLVLCEDEEDIEDKSLLTNKGIFDSSFETLARVSNIWYNKMGSNQEEIEEVLAQLFENE
jgi:hypothetical protein